MNATRPIRTAIVEDDPALRKMIVSVIEADPRYAVVAEFAEGRPAIAAIAHLSLDIALVDIGLPDISGYETAKLIRALPGSKKLVMVAVTGFDGHMVKPIELAHLAELISQLRMSRAN